MLVTNQEAGKGSLSGLSASVNYANGQPNGWLSATFDRTTTPARLTLRATPGNLGQGVFAATVTVTASQPAPGSQDLQVSFSINAAPPGSGPPRIALSTQSISFSAAQGNAGQLSETVSITNNGGGTLSGLNANVSYGAGGQSGWLTTRFDRTTAPATLTLETSAGALLEDSYAATVSISSGTAGNSPQVVGVIFDVGPAPPSQTTQTLIVNPTSITLQGTVGGSKVVGTARITSSGAPVTGLSVTMTDGQGNPPGWLSATLSQTETPATLELTGDPATLGENTYTATATVSAPQATSGAAVPVEFTVSDVPPPPPRTPTGTLRATACCFVGGEFQVLNQGNSEVARGGTLIASDVVADFDLPPGQYTAVWLPEDGQLNCLDPFGFNGKPATVTLGATTNVDFNLQCRMMGAVVHNNTPGSVYQLISIVLDGEELLTGPPLWVDPGQIHYIADGTISMGSHTISVTNGGAQGSLYTHHETFGVSWDTVSHIFPFGLGGGDPTVQEILSSFSPSHPWVSDPVTDCSSQTYRYRFEFHETGSYQLHEQVGRNWRSLRSGSYSEINLPREADYTLDFSADHPNDGSAQLQELTSIFDMDNGRDSCSTTLTYRKQ